MNEQLASGCIHFGVHSGDRYVRRNQLQSRDVTDRRNPRSGNGQAADSRSPVNAGTRQKSSVPADGAQATAVAGVGANVPEG